MPAEPKSKKRKLETPPPTKAPAPVKKPPTKPTVVTKKVVATPAHVKDAKSDSSFFSEKKVKKLPKFTKAPPPVSVKKEDTNIALPSSRDPFQEALQSMVGKGLKDSAATPPPASHHSTSVAPESGRPSKKKKTVQWAADNELEAVRFIEKAVYDDDPVDVSYFLVLHVKNRISTPSLFFLFHFQGTHSAQSARNMEKGEGAALHRHIFEETVDWSEPIRQYFFQNQSVNIISDSRNYSYRDSCGYRVQGARPGEPGKSDAGAAGGVGARRAVSFAGADTGVARGAIACAGRRGGGHPGAGDDGGS